MGYHPDVILAGRRINDDMGRFVAENLIKQLIQADIAVKGAQVAILGFTFKENCPDIRSTRVIDIVHELHEYGITPWLVDPQADAAEARHEYGVEFVDLDSVREMDAVVLAVAHDEFRLMAMSDLDVLFKKVPCANRVLIDIKGILDRTEYVTAGYRYWRL